MASAGLVGGRHLDVGAGTCRYSRYWARAGFRSVCVDVLHQMLVRARLGGTGGRLVRVCGTLDCLRSEPAFDLATAIDDVVAYVGAQEGGLDPFLGQLAARIRPGGLFLFDFITPEGRRRYTFRNSRAVSGDASRPTAGGGSTRRRACFRSTSRSRRRTTWRTSVTSCGSIRSEEIEAALRRQGFDVIVVTDLYDGLGVSFRAGQPSYDVLARRR